VAGTLPSSTDRVLAIPALAAQARLVHGFSTNRLGSMRADRAASSPLTQARKDLVAALGLASESLAVVGAVHGARVERVDQATGPVDGCDGLVTDRTGLPLLATFADCYPVLLFDPARPALALIHAGWRGAAAGVASEAVARLGREYGSDPAELVAGLGPGICDSCYEVGEEVAARFPPAFVRPSPGGRFLLDIRAALRGQLRGAGVLADRIHDLAICTRETPELLPSHRRSPDGARFACLAALS
jgi:purine-nucleoside/S-methyl-5'-thioadenosine phosphorylase / adenosine deaminase